MRARKLADKHGILLIDDEIQAGMGRTGKWFAIEHYGIEPDVICMAKGIASGFPLSATIAKSNVMNWDPGAHCTTFGGNPVACVASIAVMDVIEEENLLENAEKQGSYIKKRFESLKEESDIVGDVRGKGLMVGVEIDKNKETKKPGGEEMVKIKDKSWRKGLLLISCGESTIRIAPPLIINREVVDTGLDIIESSIKRSRKGTQVARARTFLFGSRLDVPEFPNYWLTMGADLDRVTINERTVLFLYGAVRQMSESYQVSGNHVLHISEGLCHLPLHLIHHSFDVWEEEAAAFPDPRARAAD